MELCHYSGLQRLPDAGGGCQHVSHYGDGKRWSKCRLPLKSTQLLSAFPGRP
jgi:hypothetical protein